MANEETTSSELQAPEKRALAQEHTRPGLVFRPDVDILERGDAYLIYADLPGVDDKHVEVHLEKGVLSIDAELVTASMRYGVLELRLPKTAEHRTRQIAVQAG